MNIIVDTEKYLKQRRLNFSTEKTDNHQQFPPGSLKYFWFWFYNTPFLLLSEASSCYTVTIHCVQCVHYVADLHNAELNGAGVNWGKGWSSQSTLLSCCHSDTFLYLKYTFIWPACAAVTPVNHWSNKNKHQRVGDEEKAKERQSDTNLYFKREVGHVCLCECVFKRMR